MRVDHGSPANSGFPAPLVISPSISRSGIQQPGNASCNRSRFSKEEGGCPSVRVLTDGAVQTQWRFFDTDHHRIAIGQRLFRVQKRARSHREIQTLLSMDANPAIRSDVDATL